MKNRQPPIFRIFLTAAALAGLLATSACYRSWSPMRVETAKRLAMPSFMHHREIPAGEFSITVYERVREEGKDATIYIEGEGEGAPEKDKWFGWLDRHPLSEDSTPVYPVALHLATCDSSPNVIYMARPCQYSGISATGTCPANFQMLHGFSEEAVTSMNAALDDIKKRYNITGFDLVGYAGGGGMAALVAARRHDVISIRTAAANLDTRTLAMIHATEKQKAAAEGNPPPAMLVGGMNPADVAADIKDIPQHHFIGEWDMIVTPAVYDGFRAAAGNTTCMRSSIVGSVDHEAGWANRWPHLLKQPLDCRNH